MGRADKSVSFKVGHATGSHLVPSGEYQALRTVYDETPYKVQRPASNSILVEFPCEYCNAVLSVRVFSVRRTMLKLWRWAAMMALGLLLIIWLSYEGISGRLDGQLPILGSLVALLAGCAVVGIDLGLLAMEHGLRLESGSSPDAPHALLSRHGAELGTITRRGDVRSVMGLRRRR